MSKRATPVFSFSDVWLAVMPVLPLVFFTALLSWLIPSSSQLGFLAVRADQFIARPQREYVHLGDMLTYDAVAAFHTLLCAAVIVVLAQRLRALPARCAKGGAMFLAAVCASLAVIVVFFLREADNQVIVQLGFKATCRLLEAADLPTNLTAPGCFGGGVSRLTLLAWLPMFAGMFATALAAAYAYAATCVHADPEHGVRDRSSVAWREQVEARVWALQHCIYLLSAVLVSSTIAIAQFAHLPQGLLVKGGDLDAAVSKYATGLGTMWGALFSMTLVAAVAVPALRLLDDAYGRDRDTADMADVRQWLDEHVFQSVKRQFVTVLSLLAPLLVGPLSSLVSSFSRF